MRAARLLAVLAGALMGCSALLGVKDIYLDDTDGGPNGGDGGTTDGTTGSDGPFGPDGQPLGDGQPPPGDGSGGDTGTCTADLQTSAQNCGRCGHDCQGGTCTTGKCDPVTLATSLENPSGIALDGVNVYYTTFGGAGAVALVPKAGGTPKTLATTQTSARGVQVDATGLYWSNGDFISGKGGVWKCTLPACTTPTLVAPGDWAYDVQLANGQVYFSAYNDGTVLVGLPDGGAGVVATTNHAFGLGVDSNYAYYTSSQPNLYRAALDGGAGNEESVGPLNSDSVGFVVLDATRFYWAFADTSDAGHVFGALKADPGTRVDYAGPESVGPAGVAVDATNIYWSTGGTFSGPPTSPVPNGDGKVFTCPLAGCPAAGPTLLAGKLRDTGPLVIDATSIYWCEFGDYPGATGQVRKVAKP
jgi:hypothetical protein